jgi:predicted transcriptional regulator
MIEKLLKQLGFADKEIRVYLTILEQGKTTPATVAKLTNIKRPTVYSISKELLDKGVIIEDLGGKQSHLIALPPEDLHNILKRDERNLQNKKVLVDQVITELQNFTKDTKYSIPKITFIYEEDLEDFLFKQTPEWNRSVMTHDKTWWGFQDPGVMKSYERWIDWFWTKEAPKDIILKCLSSQSPNEKQMARKGYENRQIKLWKGNFTGTTWVAGDYLLLMITDKHPHYLVQIHDPTMAHNMREMFKSIWKSETP